MGGAQPREKHVVGHEPLDVAVHVHAELAADGAHPVQAPPAQTAVGDHQVPNLPVADDRSERIERAEHGERAEAPPLLIGMDLHEADRLQDTRPVAPEAR